jgi:hypothetical protein
MLKYARIFLNGRTRALSDVMDRRVGLSVAMTTLIPQVAEDTLPKNMFIVPSIVGHRHSMKTDEPC